MRGTWACQVCLDRDPLWTPPWCARCGAPVSIGCLCDDIPATVDAARSAGRYDQWLEASIHQMKYARESARAAHLGSLLAEVLADLPAPDFVVPVPLHPRRLQQRGYNQSLLLAQALIHATGWAIGEGIVTRIVDTLPQVRMRHAERQANVRAAFAINDAHLAEDAHILLLDDVLTTGATTGEIARMLRGAGARRIDIATVARALPRGR
jgi:ComF family protein